MTYKSLVTFLGVSSLWFSSCTKTVAPADPPFLSKRIGERCVVQFRRDALGVASSVAISATINNMNGADVAQEGTLRAVEGEGIVIEQSTQPLKTYWIPYQVILTVEFTAPK